MESGNCGIGHQLFSFADGPTGDLYGSADGDGGLHVPATLFRQSRRQIFRKASAEESGAIRLSQFEDGIFAATQRCDFLPQRDDLFRRGGAEKADRQIPSLLESGRLFVRGARREFVWPDEEIPHDSSEQRNGISANRGTAVTFSPDDRASELRDLFFESAEEILQAMNDAGLPLEEHPSDKESLRSVLRAVHTLKGDSAACGYRELSELAHELEDVLTPDLAKQHAGLIAEVVLTAADTFHEMLAAYRNNLQPPAGGALREHIQWLLRKPPSVRADKATPESAATFSWTEYERLLIAESFRHGQTVYHIALHLATDALLPAAGYELAKKALESAGKILAI